MSGRRASLGYAPALAAALFGFVPAAWAADGCERTIKADVVALDQAFYNNRLGALQLGGMIFALRRDVRPTVLGAELTPGNVALRPDKRARPITLRANVGDCLEVHFQNLLAGKPLTSDGSAIQPATRLAGLHVVGVELVEASSPDAPGSIDAIAADGSWVGANDTFNPDDPSTKVFSGLVVPGARITYTFRATEEGTYLLYSTAANHGTTIGQDAFGGQLSQGLFGSLNVQPRGAQWYRSQVTRADLMLAGSGMDRTAWKPRIDYGALYPSGATYPGGGPIPPRTPILAMLDENDEIVHSDQTAIITGPNAGNFVAPCSAFPKGPPPGVDCADEPLERAPSFAPSPAYPSRYQPYREFTVIYHDDFESVQAFPAFRGEGPDAHMEYTLRAGRDFFAINYGLGGIGAPIWANRVGVGPMHQCATCKYEEFFLSSWPNGDPAMVVDVPANSPVDAAGSIGKGPKATKALFPDDPSNVYHSYMGDHARFRVLHGGTNITHVHHQHAHQWLHTPNSDQSHYRDSQMISPGAAYTLDYVYNGSGNKNQTVGDSIFHCHFYPHFAQGMWALWRVHDTFEEGTALDEKGRPVLGDDVWNRALPDGEIAAGSPTPAVVPVPTMATAPLPARTRLVEAASPADPSAIIGQRVEVHPDDLAGKMNPGYPFFVPGVAGQRAPHPPMDFAVDGGETLDGGLPRHLAVHEAGTLYEKHNRWDFTKDNDELVAYELPEGGTDVERIAMRAHAKRIHPSSTPEGNPADFILNGQPRVPGAPFAEPGVNLAGCLVTAPCATAPPGCPCGENVRRYKGVDIELDVVLNKKGWHYPQQRISTLWGDMQPTLDGQRKPEPLFFRANSGEVIEYWLANLVPNYYLLDDFQVRTPTDVLGQHIHLVKFDVLTSDGAANGFNYEDGTLAAQEVRDLIGTINKAGGLYKLPDGGGQTTLTAKFIPEFGEGPGGEWIGAQATVQRWYADPVLDNDHEDRTLRTVFTHDHFGPSTHQQAGLYAGLVVEPKGSDWRDPETGRLMGGESAPQGQRSDGGPTSWQALIVTDDPVTESYREFLLEFQDRQLAYKATSRGKAKAYEHYAGPNLPSSTPWGWADPSAALNAPNNAGQGHAPWPQLVTNTFGVGVYSLNYRNEPLDLRVFAPSGGAVTAENTDLAYVFKSIARADPALNQQPTGPIATGSAFKFPPAYTGAGKHDPYTPLLRAYEGDKVQIRTLVGAHMSAHSLNLHGLRWLFEPAYSDSGYRATQGMGISEHYEMIFTVPQTAEGSADYLYVPSSSTTGLNFGNWGILRAYGNAERGLEPLPGHRAWAQAPATCPDDAPRRTFEVRATRGRDVLGGALVYNARGRSGTMGEGQIVDWNAILYVLEDDLDSAGKLKPGRRPEPLVLRANAGDCITVELTNALPDQPLNIGRNSRPPASIPLKTSRQVGLHPNLVSYDVTHSSGVNVGNNPTQTLAPGKNGTYTWYAGKIDQGASGVPTYTPVEFGSIALTPADPLMQHPFGLLGALVIEPMGATWTEDVNSRASAKVTHEVGGKRESFREFVVVLQDDIASLRLTAPGTSATGDEPGPTVAAPPLFTGGVNYRTEPLAYRYVDPKWQSNAPGDFKAPKGISRAVSNSLVLSDPQTPVFVAEKGTPVRMRMVHPGGNAEQTFMLHGHVWQEEPYVADSTRLGDNWRSQSMGARDGFGPNNQFDIVLDQAGGENEVTGDYLYRTFIGTEFVSGIWGLLRVGEPGRDVVTVTSLEQVSAPRGGAKAGGSPRTLTIVGSFFNNGLAWLIDGQPVPAGGVSLSPGDTVVFNVEQGQHGLAFRDQAAAEQVFDFGTDAGRFAAGNTACGAGVWGTVPQGRGTIATLLVEQAVDLDFECSLHCANMVGKFTPAGGGGTGTGFRMSGTTTVNPSNGQMTGKVTIADASGTLGTASVDAVSGEWSFEHGNVPAFPIKVTSDEGGTVDAPRYARRIAQLGTAPAIVSQPLSTNDNDDTPSRFRGIAPQVTW